MRIEELVLDAFGSFEKRRISFRLDRRLHLVIGNNEAGKSTSLRALLALLYGMGEFAKDVEPHAKARLEGRLLTDSGDAIHLVRVKKGRKDEVTRADGGILDEALLEELRGDVSLDTFRSSHAMTLTALQSGSREMLAAKDDIGATLLQAKFGRLDVLAASEELAKEQKEIFTTPRSKKKLMLALDELDKARASAEFETSSPESLEKQKKELADAESEMAALRKEFESVRTELERANVCVRFADRVEKHRRLSLLASELRDIPLSSEQAARILAAANALRQGEEARVAKAAEHTQATRELARLPAEDSILAFEADVAWLKEAFESYRTSDLERAHLEKRRSELTEASIAADVEALAHRTPDLAQLLADANELAERLQTATAKQEVALKELGALEGEADEDEPDGGAQEGATADSATIAEVLRDFERQAQAEDAARLTEQTQRTRLHAQLATRQPFPGMTEAAFLAFARAQPRAALIDASYTQLERARERARALAEEHADAIAKSADAQRAHERAREAKALPTEQDLTAARGERKERLEALLGAANKADAAHALARAIDRADAVVDSLRAHATEVAERARQGAELAVLEATTLRKGDELARAREDLTRLESTLRAHFSEELANESPEALRAIAAWGESVRPLADALGEVATISEHHARNREMAAAALVRALGLPPEEIASKSLVAKGRRALDETRAREAAAEHQRRERAAWKKARSARTKDLLTLQSEKAAATEAWTKLAKRHALPLDETEGRARIANAMKAKEAMARRDALIEEQNRIDKQRSAFEVRLGELVKKLGDIDVGKGSDAATLLPPLLLRFAKAVTASEERRRIARALERVELELAAKKEALAWTDEVFDQAREKLGVTHPDEVVDLAEKAKRRDDLDVDLRVLRGELAHLGEVSPEDVARAETSIPQLAARFEALGDDLQKTERRVAALRLGIERFEQVKDGAAEALALAEAYRTEAQALARQWAVSALASQLLEEAMAKLREEAEGPIFEKASAFLSRMTHGKYTRLRVELGATRAQAIAVETKDGAAVLVDRLSDGTRDQLYLAVRLAFLVVQREGGGPALPLILDDVLTAFDDTRARATLELLYELSPQIEIIYFSHHERLLDLARSCFPDENVDDKIDVIALKRDEGAA